MLKFIDLFAGMGGTRIGFEQACSELDIKSKCVFTSEIKDYATKIYKHNFNDEKVSGDITQISSNNIPNFDFLLAGFPCQAFSAAGKKHGFQDTRGTLFFDVARIIKEKQPTGFLLENVDGLVNHDKEEGTDKTGRTLTTILNTLEEFGYQVSWRVLDSSHFGVPQKRKRIYIIGHKEKTISLDNFEAVNQHLGEVLEAGLACPRTKFRDRLLSLYSKEQLYGKAIKDKRGGSSNIHSWDLELKGSVNPIQKKLMSELLKERRKKHWAESKGIKWMDGMPLTIDEILTFFYDINRDKLKVLLDDLVSKSYLRLEYPKKQVTDDNDIKHRVYDTEGIKGYNIVTGKLSFELNKILDPNAIVNTVVATEADRLGVIDIDGIRTLSARECLRIFGFPDDYSVNIGIKNLYDLIGNTVVPPVIKECSKRLLLPHTQLLKTR